MNNAKLINELKFQQKVVGAKDLIGKYCILKFQIWKIKRVENDYADLVRNGTYCEALINDLIILPDGIIK